MGTEKSLSKTLANYLLHDIYGKCPGEPKGTPNHRLLYLVTRTIWKYRANDPSWTSEAQSTIDFLCYPQFMATPNANEQLSPSHTQWWLNGVLGLRWWAMETLDRQVNVERDRLTLLLRLRDTTTVWLGYHHALCKLFSTPTGIVAPGARAWPVNPSDPSSLKSYDGRNSQRDKLYKLIETQRWKGNRPKPTSLDDLGLVFALKLLESGDRFSSIREASDLPSLRWPISITRDGAHFSAWLTTIEGNANLRAQRLAIWDGVESYGFDDAPEPTRAGTRRIIGARKGDSNERSI